MSKLLYLIIAILAGLIIDSLIYHWTISRQYSTISTPMEGTSLLHSVGPSLLIACSGDYFDQLTEHGGLPFKSKKQKNIQVPGCQNDQAVRISNPIIAWLNDYWNDTKDFLSTWQFYVDWVVWFLLPVALISAMMRLRPAKSIY